MSPTDEQWVRFVAEVNHRCSVVSQDCADVTRFSEIPDKRFQDEDKLPKTMVAFVRLAQSILNSQEREAAVEECQLLPFAQLSLSTDDQSIHIILHQYSNNRLNRRERNL